MKQEENCRIDASMVDVRIVARASCPGFLEILFRYPGNRDVAFFFRSAQAPERVAKSAKL